MSRTLSLVFLAVLAVVLSPAPDLRYRMGRQPDGTFVVSSGQRIEPGTIVFDGRPMDLALHPSGRFAAVLSQHSVFLVDRSRVIPGAQVALGGTESYRGATWAPDGRRLYVSVAAGYVQEIDLQGMRLAAGRRFEAAPPGASGNPIPGGMDVTRDGTRLFVASSTRSAVEEIDLQTGRWVHEWSAQNIPFDVRLADRDRLLVVSNWGGRPVRRGDEEGPSDNLMIPVDPRGASSMGTVSLIPLDGSRPRAVPVGLHPSGIAIDGSRAYVANSGSDSIGVIDLSRSKTMPAIPLRWGSHRLFGSMPTALVVHGRTLYAADGGDDAVCEIDLDRSAVRGFRPAGYYPVGLAVSPDGGTAFVVNTKGNGSVRATVLGRPGGTHDFQGTVSVLDLRADLTAATRRVARLDGWTRAQAALNPSLAVYRGAIRHVVYIIKENRTYDEVFGDVAEGNGDAKLCDLGEEITPNTHSLAREFTLFDNSYTCGTNSADGHHWTDSGLANDYLERAYDAYPRSYPDDGTDAMAVSSAGFIWNAATRKGRTFRDYGELCSYRVPNIFPEPKDWMDAWRDRLADTHRFVARPTTTVNGLSAYLHPHYIYWPLLLSDQWRADTFIADFGRSSRAGRVPNLMVMTLPCDHTEGDNPKYPRPRSMVADNDLALGRIVEAVSRSPEWSSTCILVTEDDSQSETDHVDGHRTVCLAISPYTRRHFVDSTFYTQDSLLHAIELMLGLDPMNRFDALSPPLSACFTDMPNPGPFHAVPNRVRLDDMNPRIATLHGPDRYWADRSASLDWSGPDRADPQILSEVIWHSVRGARAVYPAWIAGRTAAVPLIPGRRPQ